MKLKTIRAKTKIITLIASLCVIVNLLQDSGVAVTIVRGSYVRERLANRQQSNLKSRVRSRVRAHAGVRMLDQMDDDIM